MELLNEMKKAINEEINEKGIIPFCLQLLLEAIGCGVVIFVMWSLLFLGGCIK